MKSIFCQNENIVLKKSNYSNPNTYNALDGGLAFLIFGVVMFGLNYALTSIVTFLYSFTGDYMFCNVVSALVSQGAIALIAFVFSKVKKVGFLSGGGFTCSFDPLNALFGALLCFGMYFLLNNAHYSFVDDWTELIYLTDYATKNELSGLENVWINPFITILYAFIIVPILPAICEEALFRGVIMRGLRQFGDAFAVIASALIFAIMHGGYEQFVLQFAVGLAIGSAVIISDNLFTGMAMHFLYNLGTVVLTLVPELLGNMFPFYEYLYDASGIILGFVFIITGFIYFGSMLLSKYRRKITDIPKTVYFKKYFVVSNAENLNNYAAYSFAVVLPEYYDKSCNYKFYDGKRFTAFNKRSNVTASCIVLILATVLAIIKIIVSA